jgi:uncharacterized protein YjbI with pentapeptide repeats
VREEEPRVAQQNGKPWTLIEWGGKTVWDWMHLLSALAIPVILAVVGFWFTAQQDTRQQRIESQRAEAERALAEQRAQDEALQAYLSQMSTLMLENDLRLFTEDNAPEDSKEARTLARARTLTVLGRLDARRKSQVLQFLDEAELIGSVDGKTPIIELRGAHLSDANLNYANLRGAYVYFDPATKQLITNEELDQQARSLEGTTMPDGQKYEDWLESKD